MSDEELTRILTEDAVGLTAEAREIALQEAQKRNLHPALLKGIGAQNQVYLPSEIDELCTIVQALSCPDCGRSSERLNATLLTETISIIIFTNVQRKVMIGCPDCLDKAMTKANIKTALLGWWGIPWGLIRTPQALIKNLRYRRVHHKQKANDALRGFVTVNAGRISVYKEDKAKLAKSMGW